MHTPRKLHLFAKVWDHALQIVFRLCVFGYTSNKFDVKFARHMEKNSATPRMFQTGNEKHMSIRPKIGVQRHAQKNSSIKPNFGGS